MNQVEFIGIIVGIIGGVAGVLTVLAMLGGAFYRVGRLQQGQDDIKEHLANRKEVVNGQLGALVKGVEKVDSKVTSLQELVIRFHSQPAGGSNGDEEPEQ
jgi:hypothetical protein